MVKRIVLTGGPGSGKTTIIEKIKTIYESQGIKVVIVPETATELINSGMSFFDKGISLVDFQELVLRLQLAKESIADRYTEMNEKDVLVVYDRGTIDNTAYISKEEFDVVLKRLGNVTDYSDLFNKYDLVINLVGRKDFYTTENNAARKEDADLAIELGEKTLHSWIGHKNLRIVQPKDNFEDKIREVLNIINELLKKEQVKRQVKYVVDLQKTDVEKIVNIGKKMHIRQIYLESEENVEKRVREIEFNNSISYIFSIYRINSEGKKVLVSERQIDKKTYDAIIEFKDEKCRVIEKDRYYFTYEGEYFYLDINDGEKDIGILEKNIYEKENIVLPDFVSIIEEVSQDINWSSKRMAQKNEMELKKK